MMQSLEVAGIALLLLLTAALSDDADSRRVSKHPQYFKLAHEHSGGFFNDITNRQWLVKLDIHCNEVFL
jgi:hypothetical protein